MRKCTYACACNARPPHRWTPRMNRTVLPRLLFGTSQVLSDLLHVVPLSLSRQRTWKFARDPDDMQEVPENLGRFFGPMVRSNYDDAGAGNVWRSIFQRHTSSQLGKYFHILLFPDLSSCFKRTRPCYIVNCSHTTMKHSIPSITHLLSTRSNQSAVSGKYPLMHHTSTVSRPGTLHLAKHPLICSEIPRTMEEYTVI